MKWFFTCMPFFRLSLEVPFFKNMQRKSVFPLLSLSLRSEFLEEHSKERCYFYLQNVKLRRGNLSLSYPKVNHFCSSPIKSA